MRTRVGSVLTLTLASTLAGCGSNTQPTAQTPDAQFPETVRVDVYQNRSDVAARKFEISIRNDSEQTFTITSAEIDSTQFVTPARWSPTHGPVDYAPGREIDLPAAVPAAACDDPTPTATVRLGFTIDGRHGTVEIPAVDRFDRLPVMRAEDCLIDALEEVATIDFSPQVSTEQRGGRSIGLVQMTFTPTGNPGSFTVDGVRDTVLLGLSDTRGREVEDLAIGAGVSGIGEPVTVTIPILPHRCDPHAVAEDKQGTIFTLDLTAPDGMPGTVRFPAPDATRSAIYDYFGTACDY